ncbi:MAG: MFS transporter, partial [Planctomycetota bacterium]
MTRLLNPPPPETGTYRLPEVVADAERESTEAKNFVWLALHQVMLRVGWIFKTESIVMPAFMSHVGGGPVLLGLLPVLNRLGFSIPPLLYTRRLKVMPHKKWSVVATTLAMAGPFALLSALWFTGLWRGAGGEAAAWMPWLFLAVYGIFFCLTGLNQLGAHALHGKLIRPDLRGRLFMASVVVGTPLAITAAAWLLPAWLAQEDGGFGWIFGAVAIAFLFAGMSVLPAAETADNFREQSTNAWQKLHGAWSIVRTHREARAVGILAALASANLMLFPHYQALGREEFGLDLTTTTRWFGLSVNGVALWVCVQNAATACISLVAGPLADRYGNRLALQFSVTGLAMAPLFILFLMSQSTADGVQWFWLVFAPLGFMPVTIRLLINYTLEIADSEDHPKFVSAIGMCLALP